MPLLQAISQFEFFRRLIRLSADREANALLHKGPDDGGHVITVRPCAGEVWHVLAPIQEREVDVKIVGTALDSAFLRDAPNFRYEAR
jgi:hypothetical protein